MDENVKKILMDAVVSGTLEIVEDTFNKYNFKQDESYFDYELLKSALRRSQKDIILFLLDIGCRVKNPNKIRNEETPLHLALLIEVKTEGCSSLKTNSDLTSDDLQKIIEIMLENGASFYDKNSNGDSPLNAAFKACRQNYNTLGVAYNIQFHRGFNQTNVLDDILHLCIAWYIHYKSAVEHFLKCGFDLNEPICLNSKKFNSIDFSPLIDALNYKDFNFFNSFMKHREFFVKRSDELAYLYALYESLCPRPIIDAGSMLRETLRMAKYQLFIDSKEKDDVSYFHFCCFSNELEFVRQFIDNGVNVNKSIPMEFTFSAGYTALHMAVKGKNESVIELLLKNGADPNIACKSGETPLHLACKKSKNVRIRKLLLDYKASPTIANSKGLTPLHTLVHNTKMNGLLMFDTEMSKEPWGSTNYEDDTGLTLFHIACMTNDVNRVKEFLDSGANIDSQVHSGMYKGYTALHFAIIYKQKCIVEFLLKRNAKVNVELDGSKLTPLHLACEYLHYTYADEENLMHEDRSNQLDIIKLLILHGAHVDAKNSLGMTPLLHTCTAIKKCRRICTSTERKNQSREVRDELRVARDKLKEEIGIRLTETIKILVSNKANINARTSSRSTILHIISGCKDITMTEQLMETLVNSGAKVNVVNNAGLTPLHVAAYFVNLDMVTLLLMYDANPNIKTKKFKITPLHVVIRQQSNRFYNLNYDRILYKCKFIIEKLLEYGADVNVNSAYMPFLVEDCKKVELGGYGILIQTIFIHIKKLLALKFPVSRVLQDGFFEFREHYKHPRPERMYVKDLESVFDNSCLDELDKMKKIKLNKYTSLYDILFKGPHELANYVNNRNFIKIIDDNKAFPLYSYLLRLQFKRGLLRRNIMESAEAALQKVPHINLPDTCCNLIFKDLKNKDIANIKKAILVKRNYKRKLADNYSNQIQFKSKKLKKTL